MIEIEHFLLGVHCMAHMTNLDVQTLSKLLIVSNLASLLQTLYVFLIQSPTKYLDLTKLAKVLETKGLKI